MNTYFTSLFGTGRIKTLTAPEQTKKGSALLLTLMVVSLLMVIVLAFVVFVRLELREMTNRQNLLQARSNARLGAELAIASLQELSGPDTRVTAPILSSDPLAEPNKFLIGQVVDSSAYRRSGTGTGLVYNQNYAQTLGYFISGTDSSFDPLSYWPFEDFAQTGTADAGSALLVGPGSVSDTKDENADGVPDGYVAAPIRAIDSDETGSYAYWISDEGMKAQINVTDPYLASTGTFDDRAQIATAQRVGSEAVLTNYDPTVAIQNDILNRSLNLDQLNLVSGIELGPDVARDFYHDVTLQSLGLPTNTKRGGLKRDLTAVIEETATNGGAIDPSGTQYPQLLDFQTTRLNRWRSETVALEALGGIKPPELADRHWNALNAFTIRADQADPQLNTKIFPPMSDLHLKWDMGGASWEQLLTWASLEERLDLNGNIYPSRKWQESFQLTPVIAKITVSNFYTISWPDAAMHWIPYVVLWNPYDVPIAMNNSRPWWVKFQFQSSHMGFRFRLKVRHDKWEAPNTSDFAHIQPKDELWTPSFEFGWNNSEMIFDLRDASGGTNVVIPPGEARIFSIHSEHVNIPTQGDSGQPDNKRAQVELHEGLDPNGFFSFYTTMDLKEDMLKDERRWNAEKWRPTSGSDGVPDINTFNSVSGYTEAGGGYNAWHSSSKSNKSYGNIDTAHLPYPFPLDPSLLQQTNLVSRLVKIPPLADMGISVNRDALDGWDILEIGTELGQPQWGGSSLFEPEIFLYESTSDNWPLSKILYPSINLPTQMHAARAYDPDNTRSAMGGIDYGDGNGRVDGRQTSPTFPAIDIPSASEGFTPATMGFPAYGLSYGLRLPDHAYSFEDAASQSSATSASIRWLTDFNPVSPFQQRDPASRIPKSGGYRENRFGFKGVPMYVGGFFMGDNRYSSLDWTTPDDLRQFIGHSEEIPFDFDIGSDIPQALLYELPDDINEITSIGSLMHAPLNPTSHVLMPEPRDLPGNPIGWTTDKRRLGPAMAESAVHYAFAQPAYTIGNSKAHWFVPREKAIQTFFPTPDSAIPVPIPHTPDQNPRDYWTGGESYFPGYDASYVYNEVLWDDFLMTSSYNSRIQWENGFDFTTRDFTESAQNLFLTGTFNVNSVSIPAWAALLTSMLGVAPDSSADADASTFSRFLSPVSEVFETGNDDYMSKKAYTGYRQISPDEIWNDNGSPGDYSDDTGLAPAVVNQVKLRGPFLSMSDFVNRALVSVANDINNIGLSGALQGAIEEAGLNDDMGVSTDPNVWIDPLSEYAGDTWVRNHSTRVPNFYGYTNENAVGRKDEAAPGVLMQSDILAKTGSILQARSDTFKIRAKGILGSADAPTASAWCEVTVQRIPEYVDKVSNGAEAIPSDLSLINVAFGRRFRILSFRWLTKEEI